MQYKRLNACESTLAEYGQEIYEAEVKQSMGNTRPVSGISPDSSPVFS